MNPIEAAVAPMKIDALDRAQQWAEETVKRVREELEAAGNVIEKAVPRVNVWDREYEARNQKRHMFNTLCTCHPDDIYKPGEHRSIMDDARIQKFYDRCRADATIQYDAFVAKLVEKIGPVSEASITGNHVWGYSILTVKTEAGETQNWKTQQIVNVSKLGNMFNQWPTRLMKPAKGKK